MAALRAAGATAEEVARLHSPLGLDLGAATPAETALSVAAGLLAARTGATGLPLRDLDGPDRVRVSIQSARPGALAGWLARLEARGVIVDSAAFTPNPDRTVGATLTLRSRAA